MATSKLTRVRVLGFSKMSASVLPASGFVLAPARLKPRPASRMLRSVAVSKSRRSRK